MAFVVVVSIVTLIFQEVNEKLGMVCNNFESRTLIGAQFSTDLEAWRSQSELVNRLVDQINECFGLVLLLNLGHHCASSINVFFEIVTLYTGVLLVILRYDLFNMVQILFEASNDWNMMQFPDMRRNILASLEVASRYHYSFHSIGSVAAPMTSLNLFRIWIQLLIILVPSVRMTLQVRNKS